MDILRINGIIGEREPALESILIANGVGENFTAQMMRDYLSQNTEGPFTIEVNSIGGDVIQGFEIADMIDREKAKGREVTTIGIQFDSIASIIFLKGDIRKAVRGCAALIHNSWLHPDQLGDTSLNAQTLREIADDNDEADFAMMVEYLAKAGRDNKRLIQDLMRNETQLTDRQLIDLNFATEMVAPMSTVKHGKALSYNSKALKAMAVQSVQEEAIEKETKEDEDLILKTTEMSDELSAIKQAMKTLKALIVGGRKSMVLPLKGGAGELFVFSEDGEIEGKRAVLAEGGEPTETPAPEGPHDLNDGRSITVGADGVIQSVTESAVDAMTAMEADKEKMAAEMVVKDEALAMKDEEVKAAQLALSTFKSETETKLNAMAASIEKLSAVVPGSGKEPTRHAMFTKSQDSVKDMKPSDRRLASQIASRK